MKTKLIISHQYFSYEDTLSLNKSLDSVDWYLSEKNWSEEFADIEKSTKYDLLVYMSGPLLYDLDLEHFHQQLDQKHIYHLHEISTTSHPDNYASSQVFICKPGCNSNSIKELPYGCQKVESVAEYLLLHQTPRKKTLFLDRDGIIIEDTEYPYRPESFQFIDESISLIRYFNRLDYNVFIITNQAGIARGYYSEQEFHTGIEYILAHLERHGAKVDGYNFCPYHIDGSVEQLSHLSLCRKPAPGMILQILSNNRIDLSNSLMIGDRDSDRIELTGLKSYIIGDKSKQPDFANLNELLESFKRQKTYE